MKQQFTTNVPLSQFKAIKALLDISEIGGFDILSPFRWGTEISDSGVKFTYIGLPQDTTHDELKEIFNNEWSELVKLLKARFSDIFNVVVSDKTQTITNQ